MLSFKTWSPDGTLLYGAHPSQEMYLELAMTDGKLRFSFSNGDEDVIVVTDDTYNDNLWHEVSFSLFRWFLELRQLYNWRWIAVPRTDKAQKDPWVHQVQFCFPF